MTRLTVKELMAIWKTDKSVGWHLYELCWLVTSNAESILDKTVTGKRMKGLLPRIQDFPPTYDQQVPPGTKCQVGLRTVPGNKRGSQVGYSRNRSGGNCSWIQCEIRLCCILWW